jgi:propanediol dehydratase small subunit
MNEITNRKKSEKKYEDQFSINQILKDKIKKNPIQVSPPNLKIKVMREKKKSSLALNQRAVNYMHYLGGKTY